MTKNIKNWLILAVAATCLAGGFVLHLALPDGAYSAAERRALEQAPKLTVRSVFSRAYMQELESYLLDQFPARDGMRALNAAVKRGVFLQRDVNGLYIESGSLCKLDYPLDEGAVRYAAQRMEYVRQKYLQDAADVYYAIIPDKNYFAAPASGRPHLDYARLNELMHSGLSGMQYIDLYGLLELADYYNTDIHWRQERLHGVAESLAAGMGRQLPKAEYSLRELSPFYGTYAGQYALNAGADTLSYLESGFTQSAVLTTIEGGEQPVYAAEKFSGVDGYELFSGGSSALVTIRRPGSANGPHLVIFRDSFASSLAPLLLPAYPSITLVDLRYMSPELLGEYVDFSGCDALFLFSTSILNTGRLLK